MIYRTSEGTVLSTQQELLDDLDAPIKCKPGYPKVALIDSDNQVLSSVIANPGQVPGTWFANLSVPNMNLSTATEFTVRWRVIDTTGQKYTFKDAAIVEPQVDNRETDLVTMFGDTNASFVLPTVLMSTDTASFQIYNDNAPVFQAPLSLSDSSVTLDTSGVESTRVTIPLAAITGASLHSSLLKVDIVRTGVAVPITYIYKLWSLTPQLFLTMSHLDDFLNKSRIDNIIPELRYTSGDLIGYLERGLYYFNMIEKPTSFTGLNMQGILFDAHLICSEYQALNAQILAEGSLAFDFSGQGISLNVDRTPALEAAISRIESQIDSRLVPLKKELTKNGIISGDGSVGSGSLINVYAKGMLSVMNAATTRISMPTSRFQGRRR